MMCWEGSEDGSGGSAPEAREAMAVLKGKVQSMPVLVFPNFKKPFLLETDASKEGLGVVLSQSVMEHFKEYLAYTPFVVRTDNNPLTYMLTMPNLVATGHQWVGTLASFKFELEYQKGTDNGAMDALSWVPINHSWQTIQSLLEGVIVGTSDRGETEPMKGS